MINTRRHYKMVKQDDFMSLHDYMLNGQSYSLNKKCEDRIISTRELLAGCGINLPFRFKYSNNGSDEGLEDFLRRLNEKG